MFCAHIQLKRIRRYQKGRQKSLNKKTDKTVADNKETKDKHRTQNTTQLKLE